MTIAIATTEVPFGSRCYLFTTNINAKTRMKDLGHARHLPAYLKKEILERDNYICQICGGAADQIDHIVPRRLTQDDSRSNLRACCRSCNIKRRIKRRDARLSLEDWYNQIQADRDNEQKNNQLFLL